jgi:Arm DNA-binding domain
MPLSDTAIRKAKPADSPVRLFDSGGLYLEVAPSGGKWWRLKFRVAGKEKRLSLGTYPDTGLKEAVMSVALRGFRAPDVPGSFRSLPRTVSMTVRDGAQAR